MPRREVYHLHPLGWKTDPEDEHLRISTLDYLVAQSWCAYGLFFKLPPSSSQITPDHQAKIVDVLRRGLEVTIAQCRQLCSVTAPHPDGFGDLCFHKTRTSTVELHVQWLDAPNSKYPSFADLERQHFTPPAMGSVARWCAPGMTPGKNAAAACAARPRVAGFRASFVRGGLVLMMHQHHYAGDIMGWAGQLHQLAENCAAAWRSADDCFSQAVWPSWDPMCLDFSRTTAPPVPEDRRVDAPPPPGRHSAHRPSQRVLFHLRKSSMAELKRRACPPEDGTGRWISSYDAYMAHLWRVLSKHKARVYEPDPKGHLTWGEAVDMRRRFRDPPVPERMQGNVLSVALSFAGKVPQLTTEEVISEAPLWKLAWYIRQLTNSVTQETLAETLASVATVRDKTALFYWVDTLHPTSNVCTDWRDSRPYDADFGFARPCAFRWPFDNVMENMWVVYPSRTCNPPAGDDEGNELSIVVEKEILADLLADPEWNAFFEFRAIEVDEQRAERTKTVSNVTVAEMVSETPIEVGPMAA